MFLFSLAIVKNCELSLEKSVRGDDGSEQHQRASRNLAKDAVDPLLGADYIPFKPELPRPQS